MTKQDCAVIFGATGAASPGAAIARRAARDGLPVVLAGPQQAALEPLVAAIQQAGGQASAAALDAGDAAQLNALFQRINDAGQQPALVVHAVAEAAAARPALDTPIAEAAAQWRRICKAGALVGQSAIPRMLAAQQGTLLFLAPAESPDAAVAAAAAGLRSFAQSMAREFGPKNLHVAFLALDEAAEAEAVAHSSWLLHRQHRSTWTQELDLRA